MYDVVILGGGPAGSEALFRLARAGLKTILIEKRSKGEGKPCGGATLQEESKLFGKLPSDVFDYPIKSLILRADDSKDMVVKSENSGMIGYGVKREIYDTFLMERAQKAGGKIRFKEWVQNTHSDRDYTCIETNKGTYRGRFVFVALGWRGLSFFKKLGLRKYPYKKGGFAVQKILDGEHFEQPDINYFYFLPELEGGYFWLFPKRGSTYVGCGVDMKYMRGKNLMSILDAFVDQQFGAPKIIRKEGGFIPVRVADSFYRNGFFFLGDSAGLINPLSGGGIFEARLSGKLAVDAVAEFFAGRTEDPSTDYSASIETQIIDKTHRWDAVIRRFIISPTPRRKLWDLFHQDAHYREAVRSILRYDTNHFRPFRIMLERIFHKLLQEMTEAIRPYQKRINGELRSLFQQDTELYSLVNYSLLGSGKRFRASLVCLMGEAMGINVERTLPTALSYELAHTASLVHDDIIDEGHMRRGKPSVVARYGLDRAIVSGDALIMKAYEIGVTGYRQDDLPKDDLIELVECATRSGVNACHGELLDVKIGKEPEKYSIADYIRLVEQKTAALIEGPCEAAAILAGQKNMRSTTKAFGRNIGIAFQILDDAKDIFASEDASLKGRFADFRNEKPNLYIMFIMRNAKKEDRIKLKELLAKGSLDEKDIQFIFQLCEKTGTLKSVKQLFGAYLRKASRALNRLPDSDAKTTLNKLIGAMGYWKSF